jgi:hypothetical protein
MNGEIAQQVAFVCHGNAFLAGADLPDLLATNSACQFCQAITFQDAAGEIASTPTQWMQTLHQAGVQGLRLAQAVRNDPRFSDRESAGFSGGGSQWTIEAVQRDGSSDFYAPRWIVADRTQPDRRIWAVTYIRYATATTSAGFATDLPATVERMTSALNAIHAFAQSQPDCDNWVRIFSLALESLRGSAKHGYHADLYPVGSITPIAVNIFDACQAAWVFGGMGSWNDMGFDNPDTQARYKAVSDALYRAITEAIPAAANDSFHAG